MALFKTTCPDCGEITVREYELQMTPAAVDGTAAYRFSCPGCCRMIERSASSRVATLLAEGGVPQRHFRLDVEPAPFTWEDLLDFHEMLHDDHALAAFMSDDTVARPRELTQKPTSKVADRNRVRSPQRLRRWWSRGES